MAALLALFLSFLSHNILGAPRGPRMHPEDLMYYAIPTPEPTPRPSPSPLHTFHILHSNHVHSEPTQKPSFQPSPEPTPRPSFSTTKIPKLPNTIRSSIPHNPISIQSNPSSASPTHRPLYIPLASRPPVLKLSTPKPAHAVTSNSKLSQSLTPSPIINYNFDPNICGGNEFDVVIFIDNSCGLSDDDCADLLETVGDIIGDILNYPSIRISTLLFGATRKNIDILVDFDDIGLQTNDEKYERFIRKYGQCIEGGEGDTNLYAAIKKILPMLNRKKQTKLIVISNCMDDHKVCKIAKKIHSHHVDAYIVNLYDRKSEVVNVIRTKHEAKRYLDCLTGFDQDRICYGRGVGALEDVIEDCIMPKICDAISNINYRQQIFVHVLNQKRLPLFKDISKVLQSERTLDMSYVELNESHTLRGDEDKPNDIWQTPGSDVQMVSFQIKDDSNKVWRLQAAGGYLQNQYILFFTISLHFCNIAYAIWTFFANGRLWISCLEIEVTILFIQLQSFTLYILAFIAFNHLPANIFERRYKPLSNKWRLMNFTVIGFLFVTTFTSGVFAWITNYDDYPSAARRWSQAVLYVCNIYKWFQITAAVYIVYGTLNTFPDRMKKFKKDIETSMMVKLPKVSAEVQKEPKLKNEHDDSVYSGISDYNLSEIRVSQYTRLDTKVFKQKYKKTMSKYKELVKSFRLFIIMFGICNVTMWLMLLLTVCTAISTKTDWIKEECTSKVLIWFFIHYMSEIALYFGLWLVLLFKLNRNHGEIQQFKSDFISECDGEADKMHAINDFLENEIESRSPFAIIGQLNPTSGRLFALFLSFFVPMTVYTIRFLLF